MRRLLLLVVLMVLAPVHPAGAQIAIHDDSTTFDERFGALREIDFEDLHSVVVDRMTVRNPWGVHALGIEDSSLDDGVNSFLWIGQGATIELPTRGRTIRFDGFAPPFSVRVFDHAGGSFTTSLGTFPIEIHADKGLRALQFLGTDGRGNTAMNWTATLESITLLDATGDTVAATDFEELTPDHFYLFGREIPAFAEDRDPAHLAPTRHRGVTLSKPITELNTTPLLPPWARADADNPLVNLTVDLDPGATIEFGEGTEGVMLMLDAVGQADTVMLDVIDYAGARHTVTALAMAQRDNALTADEQPFLSLPIAVSSPAGIRRVALHETSPSGSVTLGAIYLAETPAVEIGHLSAEVAALLEAEVIDEATAASLRAKLALAEATARSGYASRAATMLVEFRREALRLESDGVLVAEEAGAFVARAEYILGRLGVAVAGADATDGRQALELRRERTDASALVYSYRVPVGSVPDVVVYDLHGRAVRRLAIDATHDGRGAARWDLRDEAGQSLLAGSYFVTLRAGGAIVTEKLQIEQ
jgi:hypothetical protein